MAIKDMTPLQQALACLMSALSEKMYAAGWMHDVEYELWGIVAGRRKSCGLVDIEPDEDEALSWLYERCGGWITYEAGKGPTFVPLAEWVARYEAHRAVKA